MAKLLRKAQCHAYFWVSTHVVLGIIFRLLEIKYDLHETAELPVYSPLHWIELCVLLFTIYPWLWYVRYLAKKPFGNPQ